MTDSSLKARKIITFETYLYAAPKLLEVYQAPSHPDELRTMPYISLNRVGALLDLFRGTEHVDVQMRPAHSFGSVSLVREFTVAGHGVSMLRSHTAYRDEQAGRLVRLLPEWTGRKHDVFMVMAPGKMLRRVRIFVDYMAEFFAGHRDRGHGRYAGQLTYSPKFNDFALEFYSFVADNYALFLVSLSNALIATPPLL